jgi:hypothetical protein
MLNRSNERIEFINLDNQKEQSIFDLSASGVCCLFNRRLADNVSVSIKIGDLALKARVVYCQERVDGFRLGLQFVDVTGEQQKKLSDSVDKFSRGVALTCNIVDAPKSPS